MPITYEELTDEEKVVADEYRAENNCDYPAECSVCTRTCGSPFQDDNLANSNTGASQ